MYEGLSGFDQFARTSRIWYLGEALVFGPLSEKQLDLAVSQGRVQHRKLLASSISYLKYSSTSEPTDSVSWKVAATSKSIQTTLSMGRNNRIKSINVSHTLYGVSIMRSDILISSPFLLLCCFLSSFVCCYARPIPLSGSIMLPFDICSVLPARFSRTPMI